MARVAFLDSLLQLCVANWWVGLVYGALFGWVSYELGRLGIWIALCFTQTILCALLVHLMLCIADFDYYLPQTKPSYCDSCTKWFRVEYLMSAVQVVMTCFVAPHWPLPVLMIIGFAYDTYVCCSQPERRTLDTVSIYKYKNRLSREAVYKVIVHVTLFLLNMFYIGAYTILWDE